MAPAVGISRLPRVDPGMLARNARWLIGLCFAFAAFWKLFSPEFLNGTFFHFTLLVDGRFDGFSDLVGGVPADVTAANRDAFGRLNRSLGGTNVIQLSGSPRIAAVATFLTYWTIAIEGAIACLFLLPDRFRLAAMRDVTLVLFMISTYPIATVAGFNRLLALMGLAQTRNHFRVERVVYIACFLLMPLLKFPFAQVVRSVFG